MRRFRISWLLLLTMLTTGSSLGNAATNKAQASSIVINASDPIDSLLAWRLASSVTEGVTDFLFEACVLKNLPRDRVEPSLRKSIAYSAWHYGPRLVYHVQRAVKRKAAEIRSEAAARGESMSLEVFVRFVPEVFGSRKSILNLDLEPLAGLFTMAVDEHCFPEFWQKAAIRAIVERLRKSHIVIGWGAGP